MTPEEVPQSLIDTVRAAATGKPGLPDELSDGVIVTMLVAAWGHIYSFGYTDGFSDKEETETLAADALGEEERPHCCGM